MNDKDAKDSNTERVNEMYKTELHCHTSEVSKCSETPASYVVEEYIRLGYSTLVITNHYSKYAVGFSDDISWNEKNDIYLSPYRIAKETARGRINILLGMEFRNKFSNNDYLVYGVTEEFIKSNSCNEEQCFLNMRIGDFCDLAHKHNMLVFQAHPFRNDMTVLNPSTVDGIEVINGHMRHDSRNDIAKLWANKYNLLRVGGSDAHDYGDQGTVALLSSKPIINNEALINVLSGRPRIKLTEEIK